MNIKESLLFSILLLALTTPVGCGNKNPVTQKDKEEEPPPPMVEVAPDKGSSVQMEVLVEEGHESLCFRRIRRVVLPKDTLIVFLRRGERGLVPKGDTRIEPGDVLTFLTTSDQEGVLREWISGL